MRSAVTSGRLGINLPSESGSNDQGANSPLNARPYEVRQKRRELGRSAAVFADKAHRDVLCGQRAASSSGPLVSCQRLRPHAQSMPNGGSAKVQSHWHHIGMIVRLIVFFRRAASPGRRCDGLKGRYKLRVWPFVAHVPTILRSVCWRAKASRPSGPSTSLRLGLTGTDTRQWPRQLSRLRMLPNASGCAASSRYPARIGYSRQSPHEGMVDRSQSASASRSDPPARFGYRGALLAGRIRVDLRDDRRRIPLIHHCPPD